MSTPQAKRRRLNEAAKTLNKPFKSPFRTPLKPSTGCDPPSSDPLEIDTPVTTPVYAVALQTTAKTVQTLPSPAVPKLTTATPAPSQPRAARPLLSRQNFSTPSRALPKKALSKPSLTREIVQLRSDIQILSQAQTLATSTKDDNLAVLIDRWRTASRSAAEELFATTRDKVNRMGGVGAWKAREKEGKERQQKWDQEEREAQREKIEEARENGDIGDEVYDKYAEMADDNGTEEKEEETFKAADDDSFTMDMMLKTLNIDLQLIGYSKEAQRWDG